MEPQEYITQLEDENRQLKAQLAHSNEWLNGSLETNFIPKDLKILNEMDHLVALGNNFPNGCLFRLLVDPDILESTNSKEVWAKHVQLLYLSPSWEQMSNIPRDVAMTDFTVLMDMIHPDDQSALFPLIHKCLVDSTLINIELRYCNSDTETRWLQISTQPRREDHGCMVCDGFILDVTDCKEGEYKLMAEKKYLQDFINSIPSGAYFQFIINTNTGHMTMSQLSETWTKITGIPVAAALADVSNLFATVHREDLPSLMKQIENSAQTLCEINCIVRVNDSNSNKFRWIQVVSCPYRDKEFVVGNGIVFDITEHKINEIELAIHRDELELLVEKRTEELAAANEELETTSEKLFDTSKELMMKHCMLLDEMDARAKIMHQLEDNETKLRNFIQQSLEGILIFDNEGRIVEWNKTMEKITGLERKDAIGKFEWDVRWLFYLKEDRNQQSLDKLRRSRLEYIAAEVNQEPIMSDDTMQDISGNIHILRMSMFPIIMKDTCHFGRIVHDITENWKNEMELNRYRSNLEQMVEEKTHELTIAKQKAEESNRLKSAFLANMSHEVRTPLNIIIGLLNIMTNDQQISEGIREYIDLINRNSDQLLRLIEDILDAAKIEAGQMNIRFEPVSINDLMSEMYVIYNQQLKIHDKSYIRLENIRNVEMSKCIVKTDPVRLRQIIQNLLNNAIKFTDRGYIHFGYRVTENNMLEFYVQDTGIGIPQQEQKNIFLLFRQAEEGNFRRYSGTGLGLTISRSLAQLMGGDMYVTSAEGMGSKFTFTIAYHPCEKE